jgi:hypothetical protein
VANIDAQIIIVMVDGRFGGSSGIGSGRYLWTRSYYAVVGGTRGMMYYRS